MTAVTDAAARVREIAAAEPPEGLALVDLAVWYADRLGELRWHAVVLADAADPAGAYPAPGTATRRPVATGVTSGVTKVAPGGRECDTGCDSQDHPAASDDQAAAARPDVAR